MSQTLYFYDLETSGVNPRDARIMQFAGQRTDMNLKPIGEPHNVLIAITDEVVPEPDAILITGITPQQSRADGITEAEFLKLFQAEIATPGTIFVGFNNVRFDDEFIRFLRYRNFYDAYDWQYKDERGRWDLLDVTRMMRALRPEGILWPFDSSGKPTNRLELLTAINKLDHQNAHDALSDVQATIDLAKLIHTHQPKFFDYLLSIRHKSQVAELVLAGKPFVYTSGKYPSEYLKTTVVEVLAAHPNRKDAVLVYDLRHDPSLFAKLTPAELAEAWRWSADKEKLRLPVKTLQFNRCPAVAPLAVLDTASQQRISLSLSELEKNRRALSQTDLAERVIKAVAILDKQQQSRLLQDEMDVDTQLYDHFIDKSNTAVMEQVQAADAKTITSLKPDFKDERLKLLFPLYKARNFPRSLTSEERMAWEAFCQKRLLGGGEASRLQRYFKRLEEIAERPGLTKDQKFLLEELQLYGQSVLPVADY